MVSEINDNECSARVGNYTTASASGVHIDGLRGNLKKKRQTKGYKIKYNIDARALRLRPSTTFQNISRNKYWFVYANREKYTRDTCRLRMILTSHL